VRSLLRGAALGHVDLVVSADAAAALNSGGVP